ncbi:MAG: hypothetical protein ACK528_03230, partial [Alphaproteobacteria bacterium]
MPSPVVRPCARSHGHPQRAPTKEARNAHDWRGSSKIRREAFGNPDLAHPQRDVAKRNVQPDRFGDGVRELRVVPLHHVEELRRLREHHGIL